MLYIILACVIAVSLIAFHTYCTKVYSDIKQQDEVATNSISVPPEVPCVTPPVIVDRVQLGVGAYYDINDPLTTLIITHNVVDGWVSFDYFDNAYMHEGATLPVDDFLLKYTLKDQTNISKL